MQHDNVRPNTAARTVETLLQKLNFVVMEHPRNSADLAPSDFYLFGPLMKNCADATFQAIKSRKMLSFLLPRGHKSTVSSVDNRCGQATVDIGVDNQGDYIKK